MDLHVPEGGEFLEYCRAALDFPCKESRSEEPPLSFCPQAPTKGLAVRLGTAHLAHCAKPAAYKEQYGYNAVKLVHCIHRNELWGDPQDCRRNN